MQYKLGNALPDSFKFYHLGEVRAEDSEESPNAFYDDIHESTLISYRFEGDVKGLILVAIEKELDISIYSEMGNIIASRFANSLSRLGQDVMICSPTILDSKKVSQLLKFSTDNHLKTYSHLTGGASIKIRVLTMVGESRESLNV